MRHDLLTFIKLYARIQSLITIREAMLAANRTREENGYAQAYDDTVFFSHAKLFEAIELEIKQYMEKNK